MGKYWKYFCVEIPACMLIMGVMMGIFSFSMFVGDFAMSIVLIIENKKSNGMDPCKNKFLFIESSASVQL